jgi:protein transport protein SEC24
LAFEHVRTHCNLAGAQVEGVHEGRVLLRDWLVLFAAAAHRHLHPDLGAAELAALPADLSFPDQPMLAPLPRLVYAMLRSPLLSPGAQASAAGLPLWEQALWPTCCSTGVVLPLWV